MALENIADTIGNIDDLNIANPTNTDNLSQGDNHIRNIKKAIKQTFPQVTGAVSKSHTQLNTTVQTVEAATSIDSANSLIKRDQMGNFAANTMTGDVTGNVTGNVTGDVVGDLNGDIYRPSADGTAVKVLDVGDDNTTPSFTGNSATATSLSANRTITLSGDVSGTVATSLDGDVTIEVTVADDSHSHVISDVDDLQSSLDDKTTLTAVINALYPVGSVFTTVSAIFNPNNAFPNTNWDEFGAGKVLVGQDGTSDFNTLEETGGSKTHTLTVDEMPSHQHNSNVMSEDDRAYIGDTYPLAHKGLDIGSSGTKAPKTSNTGGDQAHNILQPYIVVKMWVRRADD